MNREIRYVLAEDEPPIRRNLIQKISRLAPDFVLAGEASGGGGALDLMKQTNPQVLFTDIRMPGVDGLELLEQVRSRYPEVHLVVISGYNEFEYARTSLRLGVEDYLLKPVDKEQLETVINTIRKKIQIRDENTDRSIQFYEDNAARNLAQKTAEIIKDQFRENITVSDLAETLKVNSTYLSRTFKEEYGMTPSRFITDRRMDLARRLLRQYPDMEIKEIAAFTGYPDQNYFSRVFKKECGVSPLEYRNNP
ncbi:MAG: AraC family transcriptional regulator [Spirochaetales bacterium]|nr:AraC family transcriptional regulator [Spirochaetales bacterium]